MVSRFDITAETPLATGGQIGVLDTPTPPASRFAPEVDPVKQRESDQNFLERFVLSDKPIEEWLPSEQANLARSLLNEFDKPAEQRAKISNAVLLSELFGVPFDTVISTQPEMMQQIYGNELQNISDLVVNKTLKEDAVQALKETPQNIWIGTVGMAASSLESMKRRAMQLAGGGLFPDEAIKNQFEAITPSPEPSLGGFRFDPNKLDFIRPQRPLPGAIAAGAFGIVTRLPDIGAKILRSKQRDLQDEQDIAEISNAPITKLSRLVFQSGIPSVAVAAGVSILTGNPMVGLVILGETEGGAAFERQLQLGGTIRKSLIIAELSEVAEIGGELIVFPKIVKGLTEGITLRKAFTLVAENTTQEGITGFNQTFLEVFGRETSKGTDNIRAAKIAFSEGVKAIPESAFVGGATAGLTGVPSTLLGRITAVGQSKKQAVRLTNDIVTELDKTLAEEVTEAAAEPVAAKVEAGEPAIPAEPVQGEPAQPTEELKGFVRRAELAQDEAATVPEVKKALSVFKKAAKRERRALRQEPNDIADAAAEVQDAVIELRLSLDKAVESGTLTQEQASNIFDTRNITETEISLVDADLAKAAEAKPPQLEQKAGESQEDFKARVQQALADFNQRVKEGKVPRVKKKGLSAEASVRAERTKNASVIKEAQNIDQTVKQLQQDIVELEKLQSENKAREGTTQFDKTFDESAKKKIKDKTAEIAGKTKEINQKLRERIQLAADTKGLTKSALSQLIKESTGFTRLFGKTIEKKTDVGQLIKLLTSVESARPAVIGHRRVLSQKIEDQIAAFKDSLIKANRLTESEFGRILKLATSKGFGQVGPGVRQPRFINAENFITQEEARDLLDRMHDSAEVIGITEPLNKAVKENKEIESALENVRKQPSSIGDPTADDISGRIQNAVFGTDFFDRLYSMRFWAQRLGDRMLQPVYRVYRSLIRQNQSLARERGKVFEFLQTLPDFDKIASDEEALQRVSDAIASKSNLKNKPEFPKLITKSELKLVDEIEKIFKVYEFHAKVGKFFQHKDDLTKMPQYLKFKKGIDRALEIYDTQGVDALFDYIKTQDWGVVSAGYEPMRAVIRKISTHQMPDVAVGKSHVKVRGIEYQQQDKNILQRLQSYMRQMDMLAFLQPKIKAWVRLIGDNLESVENEENVKQVVTTFLNNLKKTNLEDGLVEQVMRKMYSQSITVRVLADILKPLRNLLQNLGFGNDILDLFRPDNKRLTEKQLEYLETFVQQDQVMMSDWAFAGEDPLNLPFIGKKRLGIDKVTNWVQRHTLYPGSDRLNRHWSFWAKVNRVHRVFAKDQSLEEKMTEARFSDMQRSEQMVALEILAKDGVDEMSMFIAQVYTDNTHFIYAREGRSPAEQTRTGKLVLNLALFKRAATEKALLQTQKATLQGSLKSRVRASKVLVFMFAQSAIVNWIWKELTGKKHGAYDFINFLEQNSGGLELASVQKIENVYNLMIRAVAKGDSKALAALPNAITGSADYFIPYYDLGIRAIDATFDTQNIDQVVLRSIREMIDKEYRQRKRARIDRSLLEKFQLTFGGRGVDVEEERD